MAGLASPLRSRTPRHPAGCCAPLHGAIASGAFKATLMSSPFDPTRAGKPAAPAPDPGHDPPHAPTVPNTPANLAVDTTPLAIIGCDPDTGASIPVPHDAVPVSGTPEHGARALKRVIYRPGNFFRLK